MKKNILITGGAGYIGSHIAERINTNKYNIIIYDNLVTGRKKLINKKATFVKGDIKNLKQLSNTIKKNDISLIIHLAAYLNIAEAEKKKCKKVKKKFWRTDKIFNAC